MALVTCPDCQAQISDAAPACPKCGRPMGARPVEPPPVPFQAQPDAVRSAGTFFIGGGCLLFIALAVLGMLAKECR